MLKEGKLPSKNLPVKSVPATVVVPRNTLVIEKRALVSQIDLSKKLAYADFDAVCKSARLIQVSGWNMTECEERWFGEFLNLA